MQFELSVLLEIRFILKLFTKDVKRVIDEAATVQNTYAKAQPTCFSFRHEERFTTIQNIDLDKYAPAVVEAAIRDAYEEDSAHAR